jgi:hypothetical protein
LLRACQVFLFSIFVLSDFFPRSSQTLTLRPCQVFCSVLVCNTDLGFLSIPFGIMIYSIYRSLYTMNTIEKKILYQLGTAWMVERNDCCPRHQSQLGETGSLVATTESIHWDLVIRMQDAQGESQTPLGRCTSFSAAGIGSSGLPMQWWDLAFIQMMDCFGKD